MALAQNLNTTHSKKNQWTEYRNFHESFWLYHIEYNYQLESFDVQDSYFVVSAEYFVVIL